MFLISLNPDWRGPHVVGSESRDLLLLLFLSIMKLVRRLQLSLGSSVRMIRQSIFSVTPGRRLTEQAQYDVTFTTSTLKLGLSGHH